MVLTYSYKAFLISFISSSLFTNFILGFFFVNEIFKFFNLFTSITHSFWLTAGSPKTVEILVYSYIFYSNIFSGFYYEIVMFLRCSFSVVKESLKMFWKSFSFVVVICKLVAFSWSCFALDFLRLQTSQTPIVPPITTAITTMGTTTLVILPLYATGTHVPLLPSLVQPYTKHCWLSLLISALYVNE